MSVNLDNPNYIATLRARKLFKKYFSYDRDLKVYRCDEFLTILLMQNNIKLDFYNFTNVKFCGMLNIDELETTIVVNKNSPPFRRNFTIAHELGHYYLHRRLDCCFPDRAKDLLNSANSVLEMQANRFAAELVLPLPVIHVMLRCNFGFKQISFLSQTSHETLRYRLINHLREVYKMSHNKSIEMIAEFEDDSFYGYRKTNLHEFVANEAKKRILSSKYTT